MSEIKILESLSKCFEKLPGVGKKTAERYAYYVIEKMSDDDIFNLTEQLQQTKKNVKHCKICGMLTLNETCEVCSSKYRNQKQIMVVKDTKDAIAIEKTNQYNGVYHILGGLISPLEGISPDDLNIETLEKRKNDVDEIIIATSFTPNGETTALYLEKILKDEKTIISRIGYGLPAGGDIEYVDELTLKRAIDLRVINRK